MSVALQEQYVSVLTIAGSDSGGGAGIQADLKTFAALGCYGTSAITAVTVQNTLGVQDIHSIPPAIVAAQIRAVLDDIRPKAIKIGMVHTAALAATIAETLMDYPSIPVIFDPVMVSTSGHKLIQDDTIASLRSGLFRSADLLTPNIDEASMLCGQPIRSLADMLEAAEELMGLGCKAVLLKGGHLKGTLMHDVYMEAGGVSRVFASPYISTWNTHGTGCTLSAAIAANMALGHTLVESILSAKDYLTAALEAGMYVRTGAGSGPLNHFYDPLKQVRIPIANTTTLS
jgi:hydroxymethylpyrimidine/phosphomethylpyrimidine kinase